MPTYEIAHMHEQGQDIIIVPMARSFGRLTHDQQADQAGLLQQCAASAGLAGAVVPVWDVGGGRMGFLSPRPWHPFFRSISLAFVAANVNRRLTCRL